MYQTAHRFTHQGRSFIIEAEGWPDEESAAGAVIDMQVWTMRLDAGDTAALHDALSAESTALVHEAPFDHDQEPLRAVREAQRLAMQSGLQGRNGERGEATLTIEADQVTGV